MKRIILTLALALLGTAAVSAQEVYVDASMQGFAGWSENGTWHLPFWAYTNKRGVVPENSPAVVTRASGQFLWNLPKNFNIYTAIDGSVSVGKPAPKLAWYQSEKISTQQVNALYVGASWRWIHLDVGMFDRYHDEAIWNKGTSPWIDWTNGLGTTNGNIAYSRNAPSMPGYMLYTELIKVGKKKHFGFNLAWGDFFCLERMRYVSRPKIHHASINIWFAIGNHFEATIGIEDWAQWSGYDTYAGFKYASSFKDYVLMCLGRPSSSPGTVMNDQAYVLGNHLGREIIRFKVKTAPVDIVFGHDIPFNDGSGMGFQNFPDGVNTLKFELKDRKGWVTDVVYEFMYTKNQSGRFHVNPYDTNRHWGGKDSYFNSAEYKSGWTNFGKGIGSPLFTPATVQNTPYINIFAEHPTNDDQIGKITEGLRNNMVMAHHIGISGYLFHKAYYKLLATYSINEGWMSDVWGEWHADFGPFDGDFEKLRYDPPLGPYKMKPQQFSLGLEGWVPVGNHGLSILYGLYTDLGRGKTSVFERADAALKVFPNSVAVSVGLKYVFNK